MLINAEFQIEKVTSDDTTRPQLCHVQYQPEKKRMMATDGHMAAIVPVVSEDGDTEGPVSNEAIKAARKASKSNGGNVVLRANGHQVIPNGPTFDRPKLEGMAFPPIDQVIPDYRKDSEGTVTIGFNVEYLARLASAIGVSKKTGIVEMTIKIPGPKDKGQVLNAFLVVTPNNPEAIGILMPCRTR